MTKPEIRWTTLLHPKPIVITPELQKAFDKGIAKHKEIQSKYPNYTAEYANVYKTKGLPFDIIFHIDMVDWQSGTVYEIKPIGWWLDNMEYCRQQVSGYMHFLGAKKGMFMIYNGSLVHEIKVIPISWNELKRIALSNWSLTGCREAKVVNGE
jgi:hypothetical protein